MISRNAVLGSLIAGCLIGQCLVWLGADRWLLLG